MSSSIRVNVDLSAALTRLADGAAKGLVLSTEHLLQVARTKVPHDEGTLERSGQADVDKASLTGAVSFDTPYAVRQHEDMTLRHEGGRQAKYLETTLAEEQGTVLRIIGAAMEGEL